MTTPASGPPSYVRIYADAQGETHFEDVVLPTETGRSPTGVLAAVAMLPGLHGVGFREVIEEASYTEPHNAPRPLLFVTLEGEAEVEVSDGEVRRFGPGDVCLADDTTGKGHITRAVSDGTRRTLVIEVDAAATRR